MEKKNAAKNIQEFVPPAATKNVSIESKKIVFYKKQMKNVVENLAIIWTVLLYSNIVSNG